MPTLISIQVPDIIVIGGPTASGKSGLALSLAQKTAKKNINCVIINADSQQVYKELRILTARPTEAEEALAPHKLYGFLSALESFSAGKWLRMAKMEIDWALSNAVQPIVVGGTGLYLKALLQGIADIPDIAPEVRVQAVNDFAVMGKAAFADRLREIDPGFFARLAVYDRQRLIRAYEVWLGSGRTLSWWQEQGTTPPYAPEKFKLFQIDIPRDALYKRCDMRFELMLGQGAIEEVQLLQTLGIPQDAPSMKSVGIKEISAYLKHELTLEEATANACQATRNYAKRQLTWFKHQLPRATPVHYDSKTLPL